MLHAALMSDSYERIQDQAALEQQRLRAGLLLELEIDMSEEDKMDTDTFPPYLHVLIPKDHDETKFDGGDQWLGVLGAIKGEINEQGEKTKKDINGVEAKIISVEKSLQSKIRAVEESLNKEISAMEESLNKKFETKIDSVETKIEASNKKMDEILSILKSNPRT